MKNDAIKQTIYVNLKGEFGNDGCTNLFGWCLKRR